MRGIAGFVLVIAGGLLALYLMLAPAPLPYHPLIVLDVCTDESPANVAFVREFVVGESTETRVKRPVYLQGLWSTTPTADNTYTGGSCADAQAFRVFEKNAAPHADGEPYADYTVEMSFMIPEGVAPKTAEGLPTTEAHVFLVRDATAPKHFVQGILPAELWGGPAVVTIQLTRIDKRARVDIVIAPTVDDAVMLARIDCTERKLAYADWREPFACLLPRAVLERLPH
jgi:hypothetical protein